MDYGQIAGEILKTLGAAAPFILFLWKNLDQCHKERVETQELFNKQMSEQAKTYAEMVKAATDASTRFAISVHDLLEEFKELNRTQIQMHKETQDSIRDIHQDLLATFREIRRD